MAVSRIWKGHSYPLGATWCGNGVNFAIFSENATGVELCLFDSVDAAQPSLTIPIVEQDDHVWHVFLPDVRPGQYYGYRVDGPWDPANGHRFNKAKLLLDPYAKAIAGQPKWGPELFSYKMGGGEDADLTKDDSDSAGAMPKSVVIDPTFDWGKDKLLRRPLTNTVIYEVHVKGFSKLMTTIPENLRGTYAGLASPEAIKYFKNLGVTAVELLPVHQHLDSKHLLDQNLCDYWGYNTIGFFAPEPKYSSSGDSGQQVREFKEMVKALHKAGLEVILDVVYNHTIEGNQMGPALCFRGVDNASYYRLVADNKRYYNDYTGTGNTFNVTHPRVLQLLMDSLRYWVTEMHVDGFRFDLASTLARELHAVSKLSAFFDVIHQDPIISQVKLIAEPWDVGEGGYQVGNFPVLWAEWNGRYRDVVRSYWKGDSGVTSDFAFRLCGSSDLYGSSGKKPTASINFITAHDGFTLHDLTAFNDKHNEANGEGNRDGDNNGKSWNCGFEGLDAPEDVKALRRRMQRNFIATLLLSQGVAMIRGGDEFGSTQKGNNNAYCQDNEISWLNWNWDEAARRQFEFTRGIIRFMQEHAIFRQPKFFQGRDLRGTGVKDITWINADGKEMSDEEWKASFAKVLGMMLCGDSLNVTDYYGDLIRDDTFLLYFNAHFEDVPIRLQGDASVRWQLVIDTSREDGFPPKGRGRTGGSKWRLMARSFLLFKQMSGSDDEARQTPSDEPARKGAGEKKAPPHQPAPEPPLNELDPEKAAEANSSTTPSPASGNGG